MLIPSTPIQLSWCKYSLSNKIIIQTIIFAHCFPYNLQKWLLKKLAQQQVALILCLIPHLQCHGRSLQAKSWRFVSSHLNECMQPESNCWDNLKTCSKTRLAFKIISYSTSISSSVALLHGLWQQGDLMSHPKNTTATLRLMKLTDINYRMTGQETFCTHQWTLSRGLQSESHSLNVITMPLSSKTWDSLCNQEV